MHCQKCWFRRSCVWYARESWPRRLASLGKNIRIAKFFELDEERRSVISEVGQRASTMLFLTQIGLLMRRAEEMAEAIGVKSALLEARPASWWVEEELHSTALFKHSWCIIPYGKDDSTEVRKWESQFVEPKAHWDLGPELGTVIQS